MTRIAGGMLDSNQPHLLKWPPEAAGYTTQMAAIVRGDSSDASLLFLAVVPADCISHAVGSFLCHFKGPRSNFNTSKSPVYLNIDD